MTIVESIFFDMFFTSLGVGPFCGMVVLGSSHFLSSQW